MGDNELDDILDATVDVVDATAYELVSHGDLEILGLMPWSSNGTYLATASHDDLGRCQVIYKPESGEQPLWDFPPGLWRREVAAYELANQLGWQIVPPTASRLGPMGRGSVQFFVPSRFEEHYFTFREDPTHRRVLEQLCLFDIASNNTDRKGGHILLSHTGSLWGIDHGLSFHEDFKLRTVMWDFAGCAIAADLANALARWLDDGPNPALIELLSEAELDATRRRIDHLLASGVFPHDPTGRRYPWPLV